MGSGRLVIVAGPSSSGKTSIVERLRELEADDGRYWHPLGIDDVLSRLSWQWVDVGWPTGPGPWASAGMQVIEEAGRQGVQVGPLLRSLLRGYQAGVIAIVDQGVDVLVDDALLDEQHLTDWTRTIAERPVTWIGVNCSAVEMDRREAERGDRPIGLARAQRSSTPTAVSFDLELDTTSTDPSTNAQALQAYLNS